MKRLLACALAVAAFRCTTTASQPVTSAVHGLTLDEEAQVLRLEDRREFDRTTATAWLANPNSLHRVRMALALGRIGPITFDDRNGNGLLDSDETMAGVDLLIGAAKDPEFAVRRMAAFSLGEIGDPAAADALVALTADEHADVSSEAVEALSKMAAKIDLQRYAPATRDAREGVRGRALRYLFRFGSDAAQELAAAALSSPNSNDRREAAYSLSRRALASARPRLELLLSDRDVLTRAYASRALGMIADGASVDPLLKAVLDQHPWVRTNAARALTLIADKNREALRTKTLAEDVLRIVAASEDPDPGVAVTAIETLGAYAPLSRRAMERLTQFAVNGTGVQREIAAGMLAREVGFGNDSPVEALLQTDLPWIKVRAIENSTKRSDATTLRKRLATDPSAMVRAAVVGAINDPDAEIDVVRTAVDDPDPVVRATAIEKYAAAKSIPVEERVQKLRQIADSTRAETQNDARLGAVSALADLEFADRETYLRGLLGDADPVVRRVAADAIVNNLKMPRPQYTPLAGRAEASDANFYRSVAEWARAPHSATIQSAKGPIEIALLVQDAPMTSWNFASLAQRGYFNGTSFMRVVPNFVVQGGDPRNDMSGGPGYAIRDEINLQKYTRGAVGMALSGPDTGGSQFFITHSPQPHLDGGYTIFGRVTSDMALVDRLERGDRVETITIR